MDYRKVTAIIRPEVLEVVERELQAHGVNGISVTKVKGFGEYANFYSPDWMLTHVRVEVFTSRERAEEIATAVMDAAHTGVSGDGLVAVLPVESIFRIRTRSPVMEAEL